MSVYKEPKTNTWRVIYRYTDWKGERKQSQKRGFPTKREALAWEQEQKNKSASDLDMTFESFIALYTVDMKGRIKENIRYLFRAFLMLCPPPKVQYKYILFHWDFR